MAYNHHEIEKKWQSFWLSQQTFKTLNPGDAKFDSKKPKYYVLDMFPYPSGSGLHVGHAVGYIGSDIVARKKRMDGCNVLHPMGWDAFGLPAEQYAIQTGKHPAETTQINSDNFRRQLQLIGLSYDWSREINTSHPNYYRWTQWLFLKLFEKGLAYEKEEMVWWCEDLKTVLANEEVINGRSERGNFPCERRPLKQWILKITAYADRLLKDLELLDWPESVKKMQQEWIGKSEGAEINFKLADDSSSIKIYTTRPETIFGCTAVVLAPEHPLAVQASQKNEAVKNYLQMVAAKSERERQSEIKEVSGVFSGLFALNPFLTPNHPKAKIPVYIADYVLSGYGTGAVMSVPAHDDRDFRFARHFDLPIVHVVRPPNGSINNDQCYLEDGILENSEFMNGKNCAEAKAITIVEAEKRKVGTRSIKYRLRDWLFSRQRYWGEPFPLSYKPDGSITALSEGELPLTLPAMSDFTPSADGSAPLARVREWVEYTDSKTKQKFLRVTDTMPGWAGSCWYYLRFMDPSNDTACFSREAEKYWGQVDLYIGGAAHAVMHLLYARFWHKVLYDCGLVSNVEPFKKLFNQGMITAFAFKDHTGRLVASDEVVARENKWFSTKTNQEVERFITKMAKSLRNVVNPDDVIAKYGADTLRLYEMFMGPLDSEKPWTDEGITGCHKFVQRVWNLLTDETNSLKAHLIKDQAVEASPASLKIERALNRCLKRINDSFALFNFNVAIAAGMEFLNVIADDQLALTKSQAERLVLMYSVFMPHVTEELWQKLGHQNSLTYEPWPKLNENYLEETTFELVIQNNGKLKKRIQANRGISDEEAKKIALEQLGLKSNDPALVKIIVIPNRLVNVVTRG